MDLLNPYAAQHASPQGPGDSRPTALQIIQDNNLLDAWGDKVALVTGGTSGIGLETALALHATGARVFITARDEKKGADAVEHIRAHSTGKGGVEFITLDLDSLDSVKEGAREFLRRSSRLNILVNNAGIMAVPYTLTATGPERHFAVNHLAHFTLTLSLLPTLLSTSKSAASPDFASRIIQVSSSSHRFSTVDVADLTYEKLPYDKFLAYGASKTAMIWTANQLNRLYSSRGVHALSVHPGGIWSGLQRHLDAESESVAAWKEDEELGRHMKSAAQGAATTVWGATAGVLEGVGGVYLAECKVARESRMEDRFSALDDGFAAYAFDEEGERGLWEVSLGLAGVRAP
ncbi:NAD(P)-binding protein [Aspergillus karnatakaensis]|uniref:NAD(P)-binding protein n=1 Tax=Aspergillus karnatakaensis TaxID=1810916 RepID=UPI003CCDBB5C